VCVVIGTGTTQVSQQPQDRVLPDSQHAAGSIDGVFFYQCAYDLTLSVTGMAINNVLRLRDRSRIIKRNGKKTQKPVCCSARSQRREERWPGASRQYDCGAAQ
jgi:hypothetical protein